MEDYNKLIDNEDLPALIEISTQEHIKDTFALIEALESVLGQWHYDFICGKFPNIHESEYLDGIEAIESLQKQRQHLYRCDYYLMVAETLASNDAEQALEWIEKASAEIRAKLDNEPEDLQAGHEEIKCLISKRELIVSHPEFNDKTESLPRLANRIFSLCQQYAQTYPDTNIWTTWVHELLYQGLPSLPWQQFKKTARKLFEQNKLPALLIIDSFNPQYIHITSELPKAFQDERLYWLIQAKTQSLEPKPNEHAYHHAGHLYAKAAKDFKVLWMLEHAEKIFNHCAREYPTSWCPVVYAANAKLEQFDYHDYDPDELNQKYAEIYQHYLNAVQRMPEQFTLLMHACEFLTAYINNETNGINKQRLNAKRIEWALVTDKHGQGHYWKPYQFLIDSYVLLDQADEVENWMIRGFLTLNLVVDKEFQALAKRSYFQQHEPLRALLETMTTYLASMENRIWYGGMEHDYLNSLSLHELRTECDNYIRAKGQYKLKNY